MFKLVLEMAEEPQYLQSYHTLPLSGTGTCPRTLHSARVPEAITHHGVQGGVPLVGRPQAGGLQLVAAAVAPQLTLPAQAVRRAPSFQEGPHCPQEPGPQRLEPWPSRGQWVAQQRLVVG